MHGEKRPNVPGLTSALLAKFCIFFGMVALNNRVCRWDWNFNQDDTKTVLLRVDLIVNVGDQS